MIQGHGGNIYAVARQLGCGPDEITDMSSNINPMGMPPGLLTHLHEHLDKVGVLPEVDAQAAVHRIAGFLDIDPEYVLAGSGTTQFIYTVCPALNIRKALIVGPTYADYADACRMHHVDHGYFLADAASQFDVDLDELGRYLENIDTVFICNPNNPTGRLIPHDRLHLFCRSHPKIRFIIDESYLPFAPAEHSQSMMTNTPDNVIVLWSASKIFGLPGLRAGFIVAGKHHVSRFKNYTPPWSLNSLAQASVEYIGNHASAIMQFVESTRDYLEQERQHFQAFLASHTPLDIYPSVTSYFLIRLPEEVTAGRVCREMARQRILIRNCRNFHGLSDRFVRVALKKPEANRLAADYLAAYIRSIISS